MTLLPLPGNCYMLTWIRPGRGVERLCGLDDTAFLDELQAAFDYRLSAPRQVDTRRCHSLHLVEARG